MRDALIITRRPALGGLVVSGVAMHTEPPR